MFEYLLRWLNRVEINVLDTARIYSRQSSTYRQCDSSRVIDSEAGWEIWHEAERTPGGERQALSADLVHGIHVATNTEKMAGGLVRGDVHWALSLK